MAEATIALSIPGLFLTCVQYFTLVRLGREFTNDFGSCLLQLRATEIRLHRWGRAAGITDERSETFLKQLQDNYTPQEVTFAHNACKQIAKRLHRAKEYSLDMMDMNHGAEEPDVAEEMQRMKICAPEASRASHALKSVKSGYERSLQFTSKVAVRGKWALYKKTELTTLLSVISEHVATLEKLFPEQERSLAVREAESMEPDAIKVLASITTASDPVLAEALKAVAPQHGFSWNKIVKTGYTPIHLGNNFREPNANASPSSWKDFTSGGFTTIHTGSNYGYDTIPPLQFAYGPNPQPPPPAFRDMDDPDWPLGQRSDPLLATAMEKDSPRQEFAYQNLHMDNRTQMLDGHDYNQIPRPEGLTIYGDIEAGSDDARHAGNSYESNKLAPPFRSLSLSEMEELALGQSPRSRLNRLLTHQNDQVIAAERVPGQVFQHVIDPEATHGTKSSPHQLDPPHPLIDRSDVYDDVGRSSKSSVTAPETYGTSSKPFQDIIGFSSVGDNPTRALSSATGLETHAIPERDCGSIERDSFDDEHAADTLSIHTDGREHNLVPDTELSLAKTFAYHILESLTPQQLNNLFDQQDAIASIAELIGDFSVLLGANIAYDDARSSAVIFVRHRRKVIANELASAAKAWRPSNEDQVSMEEKLKMLHFGDTDPTQYDDPNLEQDSAGSHEDEDQQGSFSAGNDTPELRDVVLGRDFVLGSKELPWMIDRVQRYESLLHTGKIFSSVRSGIARTIETNSEHVEFSLDWDIPTMLNQQYDGKSRSHICLSNMIVYNGTTSLYYASTTSEYAKQVWPALGAAVIACFDRALVSTDSTSTLYMQDSRLHIKLHGATIKLFLDATTEKSTSQSRIHMLEAAEVCIWLATACCANTHEELIGLNFPQLANLTGQPTPPEFRGSVINDPSLDGQCWFKMVNNPVIASGYPIPKREDTSKQRGLEVSLGLMAALSHADWATNFGSKLLLKGTISALVPIAEVGMSIVWHFLINTSQESMSYHQACDVAIDTPHLTYSDLGCRRHFVGIWAQSTRILAGSKHDTIYDLHPSQSKPISHSTISWSGLSINGGKFLTVGATFTIGKKDLAPALKTSEARVYENHIRDASNMTVLFYSSLDRRSWLLDGASALIHLARAWLTSREAEDGTSGATVKLNYIADNGGRSSALKVLRDNQEIVIFEETTEVHETSIPVESISEPDNPSTDSGYVSIAGSSSPEIKRSAKRTTSQWTYKSLIIDLWRNLEAMKAKLVQLKQHGPEVSVRFPSTSPILTGWDVSDFLIGRTPLEPRFVKLKPEGKAWNKFTKEIFSVPLMAESFGDLILPAVPGSQVCQSASTLPAGRDLLAVPLSVLLLTAHRFLRWQENLAHDCARVTDHTFLIGAESPASPCHCFQDSNCEAISGLTNKAKKSTRTWPSIFQSCPDAVVVIGMPSARRIWERKTQDISSSTQAVHPVSDHPAASSSGSVVDTTSHACSASQDKLEDLSEGESDPLSGLVSDRPATLSSGSTANIESKARSASQDSQVDLSEGERDSLSGGSVYGSCEDL